MGVAHWRRYGVAYRPCRNGRRITLWVDDKGVGNMEDPLLQYGLVGFGVFGNGREVVRDLRVEAIP
jgi:hypothetical protein